MKTLFYDEKTVTLLQQLNRSVPNYIFSDGACCVDFDYGDFYIRAKPESVVADTQNDSDEAIAIKFERVESVLQRHESDKLLFENKAIDRLWILRTFLYFTDHVVYRNETEAIAHIAAEMRTEQFWVDILRKATGGHDEVVCHPQSAEAKNINKDYANLVDAGVMLEIEGKLLMCFAWQNAYQVVGRVMALDELKDKVVPYYEFIEL